MPQFSSGEQKTAIISMSNPTEKAFDYEGVLYMGTTLAVMSQVPFHLDAGEQRDISFPVTMPITIGTYPVHIGVFSDGESIGLFKAVEDVVIVGVAEFAYVSAIRQTKYETAPGQPWSAHGLRVEIDVKNISNVAGVCTVQAQIACAEGDWEWGNFLTLQDALKQATIQPGGIVTFYDTSLDSPAYGYTCKVRFTGDPGTTPEVSMI